MIRYITLSLLLILNVCSKNAKAQKTGNPYLDAKVSPSLKMQRENQKIIAQGNKEYLKQEEKNKRDIKKNNDAFFNKKAQYKKKKKRKQKQRRAQL